MSSFLGAAGLGTYVIAEDDWRLDATWMSDLQREFIRVRTPFSYRNQYWPRAAFVGDMSTDFGVLEPDWRHSPDLTRGHNTRYGIIGVTRDVYGAPLGGVLVKLFRLSDDEKMDQIVSDPSGNYLVSTPWYPDPHYLVMYKQGSPDVFGSSPNTLIAG